MVTILIWFISLWTALSLLIAILAFFSKGDSKFRQYDIKTSLAIGAYFFISPVFIPYVRYQDKKYKKSLKESKNEWMDRS